MHRKKTFAIVGGGIGGLTLAIAMQRQGFQVTVFENAPAIKPLGAGLGLAANAVKALAEIGIRDEVLKVGMVMQKMIIKDQAGRSLNEADSERISAKYGVINNFTVHRADLHEVLIRQLIPGTLRLGKGCIRFEQNASRVTLHFSDGTAVQVDAVIACDGIRSVFRKELIPESKPRYAGYTCWRAVIDNVPAEVNPTETSETWGQGCRFGIVPLTNNRLYWFATINAPQDDPVMKSFQVAELKTWFRNFHSPVQQILDHTENEQLIWADILDLEPLNRFAFNNIVLMGDAAHATTPNMGQGACMAIEDAAVLTNCLIKHNDVTEAFRAFERKRIRRTTKIVKGSWSLGKIAQLQNPFLVGLRNTAIRLTPTSVAERQMKFLYEISF